MKVFKRKELPQIELSFETPDQTIEVEPGKAQSVQKLYQDFVLGRLNPSDIGNAPVYDSPEGHITEELDPFNSFGMTLEQADALRQSAEREVKRAKKQPKKDVANAEPDAMPPEASDEEQKREDDKQTK